MEPQWGEDGRGSIVAAAAVVVVGCCWHLTGKTSAGDEVRRWTSSNRPSRSVLAPPLPVRCSGDEAVGRGRHRRRERWSTGGRRAELSVVLRCYFHQIDNLLSGKCCESIPHRISSVSETSAGKKRRLLLEEEEEVIAIGSTIADGPTTVLFADE